jgi:ATP-dependent Lon protease
VIIPKENEKDLIDIPAVVLADLKVIPVGHMDEVLLHAIAFEKDDTLQLRLESAKTAFALEYSDTFTDPAVAVTH